MSETPRRHRNSLNVTLDDSFEIDLSESQIFEVVLGSPISMTVPEFSGGIDEKLVFFINACELVLDITPVANQDIMLRTILNRIKGLAYEAVSEGSTQGKSASDALAVQNNIREQALLVFLEGISDRIKLMVKSKHPATLEQAIQIAIIEDTNTAPSEVRQKSSNFQNKGETQKFNKGNCHVCGKYGHYARDCRFKKNNTKNEGKTNMNRTIAGTYMVCEYCSKKGHTIDKFFKKKNEDKRSKGESFNSGNGSRSQE
ncbi:protein DDB G0276689-like [Aphis craccivora]|uniref:Protein DDB G0276689-like n=1 Tax=Aphis craccivora TaxID=307492 RepID=A0A6G0WPU5_APHCR|nr:protein DDB G0276689-like [Aphis craccivora]